MCLQDEETDYHRSERLREQGVIAAKELLEGNEIVVALTHFLAGNGDHVVVHPIVHRFLAERCARLCYLRLVVREDQIQAASVDIKLLAEVLGAHRRALHVPSGESF